MNIEVHSATRGVWWPFRFECPACHHIVAGRAYGAARAAGSSRFASWTEANAELAAYEDAQRIAQTATCPACGHRDSSALQRYRRSRTRIVVTGVVAAAAVVGVSVWVAPSSDFIWLAVVGLVLVGALLGGQPLPAKSLPPPEGRVVFGPAAASCALFLCSRCQRTAGTLSLRNDTLELRESIEDVDDPIDSEEVGALVAGLHACDARQLWTYAPRWVPFYCSECNASYCPDHWKAIVHADHAGEGYRDAPLDVDETVTLECPEGHDHAML